MSRVKTISTSKDCLITHCADCGKPKKSRGGFRCGSCARRRVILNELNKNKVKEEDNGV